MKYLNVLICQAVSIVALGLFAAAQEIPEPTLVSGAMPFYPAIARAARISGEVKLEFTLGPNGEVASVRTISGHPMLKPAAEAIVASWRFKLPGNLFRTEWKYATTFQFKFSEVPEGYEHPKLTLVLNSFHSVEVITDAPSDRYASNCPNAEEKQPASGIADTDFVEVSRSGCYGTCPAYTVRVVASGEVDWEGSSFVAVRGERRARIEASQARALLNRFLAPEVWSLCGGYSRGVTDSATTTTRISIGGREKTISNYADSAPAWFEEFEDVVDSVSNSHQWRHGDAAHEPLWNIFQDSRLPKPGVTTLMVAAADADVSKMQKAIEFGDEVSAVDTSGWSALMYAAASSHAEPVKFLLAAGANPNQASRKGDTPLMTSAIAGSFDEDLLSAGARINAQNTDGQTALMILAAKGETDEVKSALSAGADASLRDAKGRTALDYLRLANCGKHPLGEYQMSEGGKCDHLDEDDVKAATKLLEQARHRK